MEQTKDVRRENPLGSQPIPRLLLNFAVPSIIAMLVSSLYNLVDQVFIGHAIGTLGNAATNIVFPLNTTCTAISLLLGIGGAASFNLAMGEKKEKVAGWYVGNAFAMLLILGCALALLAEIFLAPMLRFFGSPEDVLPYAMEYTRNRSPGLPIPDCLHRRRTSDPRRWQPPVYADLQSVRGHSQYIPGCPVRLWVWMGDVWCGAGYRDRTDSFLCISDPLHAQLQNSASHERILQTQAGDCHPDYRPRCGTVF